MTYLQAIKDYDKEMKRHYDLWDPSKPLDSFSNQVVGRLKNPNKKRARLLNIIRDQGFDLKLD